MGDMHRSVNSTEVEGEVKPRVSFAEEKGKEVVKPKENMVTQFNPQSRPIIPKGIPAHRAWESHPNAWNVAGTVAPPLQGGWTTAPLYSIPSSSKICKNTLGVNCRGLPPVTSSDSQSDVFLL